MKTNLFTKMDQIVFTIAGIIFFTAFLAMSGMVPGIPTGSFGISPDQIYMGLTGSVLLTFLSQISIKDMEKRLLAMFNRSAMVVLFVMSLWIAFVAFQQSTNPTGYLFVACMVSISFMALWQSSIEDYSPKLRTSSVAAS